MYEEAKSKILSNPHARQAYYDELRARRQARPVVRELEVKIDVSKLQPVEYPDRGIDINSETAITVGDLQRLITLQRLQKKAARRRLKEIGIR